MIKQSIEKYESIKNKITLPFLILQAGYVVYVSQVFYKIYSVNKLQSGATKIPINDIFNEIGLNIQLPGIHDDKNKHVFHKHTILEDGRVIYLILKEILWDSKPASQLFIYE